MKLGLGPVKLKVYGQLAYNFYGGGRDAQGIRSAEPRRHDRQDRRSRRGLTLGSDYQIKKKGDYVFLAEYRQVGLGSVDPNLNDSDWNFSRLGFKGFKVAGSYGFYPWLIGTVTDYFSNNLGSEKNLNIGVGNYQRQPIYPVRSDDEVLNCSS